MTFYEVRSTDVDPATAFQAACNACQRAGLAPSGVHVGARVAIYATGLHFKRGSIGELVTVRVWSSGGSTRVGFEGTPVLGPWSRATVDGLLDHVVEEFDAVLAAPEARMRDIQAPPRKGRPFGPIPKVLGLVEVGAALLFWLVWVGGALGFFAMAMALVNGVLCLVPSRRAWWRAATFGTALLNLPSGVAGFIAGRLALAQALWPKGGTRTTGPEPGTVPVVRAPEGGERS